MGWGNCGQDSNGRPIGYMHDATCDHPGCEAKIHRGLAYACGGMHGDCGGQACEGYFCPEHLISVDRHAMGYAELEQGQLCPSCYEAAAKHIGEGVMAGDLRIVDPDANPRQESATQPVGNGEAGARILCKR